MIPLITQRLNKFSLYMQFVIAVVLSRLLGI